MFRMQPLGQLRHWPKMADRVMASLISSTFDGPFRATITPHFCEQFNIKFFQEVPKINSQSE
jgi:hypothetical protein